MGPKAKTRVYVAGPWESRETIADAILELQEAGYEITHDWTKVTPPAPGSGYSAMLRAHAERDLEGVADADVLVLMLTGYTTRGAWLEVGYHIGLKHDRARVIVVSREAKLCIFERLPCVSHVATITEAIAVLRARDAA